MTNPRRNGDLIAQLTACAKRGMNCTEAALATGLTKSRVSQICKANKIRLAQGSSRADDEETLAMIRLRASGLSSADVSMRFDCSAERIRVSTDRVAVDDINHPDPSTTIEQIRTHYPWRTV